MRLTWPTHRSWLRISIASIPLIFAFFRTWVLETLSVQWIRKIWRRQYWIDSVSNTQVLKKAKISGIEAMLMRNQLRWVGHIKRMVDVRLQKRLLYGQLKTGYRKRGRPKLRYSDTVQVSLKATNISLGTWEALVMKRGAWRAAIFNGVRRFEEQRTGLLEEQRAARKRAIPCPGTLLF